ncbi:ABC transporter permease [Paenibacillus cymbidii]|uniref:ABC transporter permease n=1 Tax=Paenibacillus cymbidii TaxID=1639034 RepID=UPI00108099DB|nr:ABC transporter permease subunit [Paenibacillus cymbidii]
MLTTLRKDFAKYKYLYLMVAPLVIYYVVFHYMPMYGAVIAFQDFSPGLGIAGSKWVGLQHFSDFINSYYFWRLVKNTFLLSFYSLIFGFPAPILLALLINELGKDLFKRFVQTISYLPHFISTVVICGIVIDMTSSDGLINDIIAMFGGERASLLSNPGLFRTIFVSSSIWTELGWGTIIYLAALSTVNPHLYEAAEMDGAGRYTKIRHITLPAIAPVIVILLILQMGRLLSVGWEKVMLLYNPLVYDTADVISTYVYRRGLEQADYSYSTAIGLFNAVINFILLVIANKIGQKTNETSLW